MKNLIYLVFLVVFTVNAADPAVGTTPKFDLEAEANETEAVFEEHSVTNFKEIHEECLAVFKSLEGEQGVHNVEISQTMMLDTTTGTMGISMELAIQEKNEAVLKFGKVTPSKNKTEVLDRKGTVFGEVDGHTVEVSLAGKSKTFTIISDGALCQLFHLKAGADEEKYTADEHTLVKVGQIGEFTIIENAMLQNTGENIWKACRSGEGCVHAPRHVLLAVEKEKDADTEDKIQPQEVKPVDLGGEKKEPSSRKQRRKNKKNRNK